MNENKFMRRGTRNSKTTFVGGWTPDTLRIAYHNGGAKGLAKCVTDSCNKYVGPDHEGYVRALLFEAFEAVAAVVGPTIPKAPKAPHTQHLKNVTCPECKGEKMVSCTEPGCRAGIIITEGKNGMATEDCPICNGAPRIECFKCDGHGKVCDVGAVHKPTINQDDIDEINRRRPAPEPMCCKRCGMSYYVKDPFNGYCSEACQSEIRR